MNDQVFSDNELVEYLLDCGSPDTMRAIDRSSQSDPELAAKLEIIRSVFGFPMRDASDAEVIGKIAVAVPSDDATQRKSRRPIWRRLVVYSIPLSVAATVLFVLCFYSAPLRPIAPIAQNDTGITSRDEIVAIVRETTVAAIHDDLVPTICKEITCAVSIELQPIVTEKIASAIRDEVPPAMREAFASAVGDDWRSLVREKLAADIRDEIMPMMREEVKKAFSNDEGSQFVEHVAIAFRDEVTPFLREEFATALSNEMEGTMRGQITAIFRDELTPLMHEEVMTAVESKVGTLLNERIAAAFREVVVPALKEKAATTYTWTDAPVMLTSPPVIFDEVSLSLALGWDQQRFAQMVRLCEGRQEFQYVSLGERWTNLMHFASTDAAHSKRDRLALCHSWDMPTDYLPDLAETIH